MAYLELFSYRTSPGNSALGCLVFRKGTLERLLLLFKQICKWESKGESIVLT